jgi:hypothetical protein
MSFATSPVVDRERTVARIFWSKLVMSRGRENWSAVDVTNLQCIDSPELESTTVN